MKGTRLLGVALGLVLVGAGLLNGSAERVRAADEYCDGLPVTIYATGGVTNGTRGNDVILGSEGDDTINGGSGDDTICDWWGNNVIHGNSGHDVIYGSGTLYGDSGNDSIVFYDDTYYIDGGSGNDGIYDNSSSGYVPVVHGGSGADEIYLWSADEVYGDSGNDFIQVNFGEGRQTASVGLLDCGTGIDYYAAYGVDQIKRCERWAYN